MNDRFIPDTIAQCDAINYQEILDGDTRAVPAALRERAVPDIGTDSVPVAHYTSPAIFAESIEKVWMKTWQMACREEEIPNPGDYYIYDVVGKSLIVSRGEDGEIRALHNSCLHRGRKLVTQNGSKPEFRCPFHGFIWSNDGTFLHNPIEFDFSHCPKDKMRLPEAKVALWGGFVFVNFDFDAPSLESIIHPIPEHFKRWALEDKYIAAHVAKRTRANWMITAEAFMETHHDIGTHPQILPFITDANAQYDIFSDHVTRHISGRGYQSPFITDRVLTQDEIVAAWIGRPGTGRGRVMIKDPDLKVPDGMTARTYVSELARRSLEEQTGYDCSDAADCELGDSLIYNVFPNLSVWGGFTPNTVYRWRPVGTRYNESMMEIYRLQRIPKDQTRPSPAPMHLLEDHESWASAEELGGLGAVIDQDWSNMEAMQEGLEASATGVVQFGHYLEMRIRQQHMTFEAYLNRNS